MRGIEKKNSEESILILRSFFCNNDYHYTIEAIVLNIMMPVNYRQSDFYPKFFYNLLNSLK